MRLTLSVERAECTAGTFTPVSWTIMGGTAPHTLTVAGETVAADEGTVTVPCGGLRDDGRPVPATIEAHVTDSTGATAPATAAYTIVQPVAAPPPSARPAGVEPLALTLTAGRSECTAGTLSPVTWTITGGTPPDTLTVDGASVDPDAESATITCGNLPEGATEAPGTITAVVTDATGAPAAASAAYTIVPPLPAPRLSPRPATVEETAIFMAWWPVPGARPASGVGLYLLRWRPADTSTWRYVTVENQDPPNEWVVGAVWELEGGETYQHQSAAMRDPIEQETPQQLAWSATQTTTTRAPADRRGGHGDARHADCPLEPAIRVAGVDHPQSAPGRYAPDRPQLAARRSTRRSGDLRGLEAGNDVYHYRECPRGLPRAFIDEYPSEDDIRASRLDTAAARTTECTGQRNPRQHHGALGTPAHGSTSDLSSVCRASHRPRQTR